MVGMERTLKKQLTTKLLWAQLQPLRIISYAFLPGLFIPSLAIHWQSSTMIFSWLSALTAANIGYIAFNERKYLQKLGKKDALHWLAIIFIGIFTIEFTGISIHTLYSLFEGQPSDVLKFWNSMGIIFIFLGGSVLETIYCIGEKYSDKKIGVKDRGGLLLVIFSVVLLFFISFIAMRFIQMKIL